MMWVICALIINGFVGVAFDFSRALLVKQSLQNAADAAALVAERLADKPFPERHVFAK